MINTIRPKAMVKNGAKLPVFTVERKGVAENTIENCAELWAWEPAPGKIRVTAETPALRSMVLPISFAIGNTIAPGRYGIDHAAALPPLSFVWPSKAKRPGRFAPGPRPANVPDRQ